MNSSLSDVFCHLTNYSVNRNNVAYLHNEDSGSRQGHKWTLSQLWSYLWEQGIDTKQIHERIKDLVIKTIISCGEKLYFVTFVMFQAKKNQDKCNKSFHFLLSC